MRPILPAAGRLLLEQGRPAEVVDVVDVDAGPDDPSHVVDVPALARRDDRDAAVAVRDGEVRLRRPRPRRPSRAPFRTFLSSS
jgi:hypothetical protein